MKAKKKEAEEKDRPLREKILRVSELPKDVVMGMPVLNVLGQSELHLENYRGILEYTEETVRILIKGGQIKVTGRNLQVVYYTNDEMKISGYIKSIEYHR
ncbi:sporulation protein YqfC [Lachnospiraceae bacterium KGMB03038]|nr:sporulation protein YqfC [Lachnospiraceae bacterium KGMB03038]